MEHPVNCFCADAEHVDIWTLAAAHSRTNDGDRTTNQRAVEKQPVRVSFRGRNESGNRRQIVRCER